MPILLQTSCYNRVPQSRHCVHPAVTKYLVLVASKSQFRVPADLPFHSKQQKHWTKYMKQLFQTLKSSGYLVTHSRLWLWEREKTQIEDGRLNNLRCYSSGRLRCCLEFPKAAYQEEKSNILKEFREPTWGFPMCLQLNTSLSGQTVTLDKLLEKQLWKRGTLGSHLLGVKVWVSVGHTVAFSWDPEGPSLSQSTTSWDHGLKKLSSSNSYTDSLSWRRV